MTNIEKIRAEISRLEAKEISLNESYRETYAFAYLGALYDVKKFLDVLEKDEAETIVDDGALEEELKAWYNEHFKGKRMWDNYSGHYLQKSSQIKLVRHFFELGKSVL